MGEGLITRQATRQFDTRLFGLSMTPCGKLSKEILCRKYFLTVTGILSGVTQKSKFN